MGTSTAPWPGQEYATSLIHPRKRKRNETAEQHAAAPTPATSRFRVNCYRMAMFPGPPQPPPPPIHTGQHWNPAMLQADAAAAQRHPTIPLSGQQGVPHPATTSKALPIVSVPPAGPIGDPNGNDKVIKPIDGEPNELSCNYTWTLDRAETHLGFTGQYDKTSEIRQTSIGYDVALKLQKMLKKLSATFDKHVTLANRVHILTVMREIIAATLEADHTVGKECRECSREFDSTYLGALRKLTPEQLRRLKSLEEGKWLEELRDLVAEAKRQNMFPLLERALDYLNSAA
ncbi:hypothetical protein F4859DRAFT_483460 [Xylaria cf. heliscus]|nr:hypothetical protein F4859DRAFT_483460 [Xylaria cf. heliscus]